MPANQNCVHCVANSMNRWYFLQGKRCNDGIKWHDLVMYFCTLTWPRTPCRPSTMYCVDQTRLRFTIIHLRPVNLHPNPLLRIPCCGCPLILPLTLSHTHTHTHTHPYTHTVYHVCYSMHMPKSKSTSMTNSKTYTLKYKASGICRVAGTQS